MSETSFIKTNKMNTVIRTNNHGQLSYNQAQKVFTVEFGNVQFKLSEDSFQLFEKQLTNLSNDYSMYNSVNKIMVPVANTEITMILSTEELIGLKNLFGIKTNALTEFKLTINYSIN
jgi:hypothetical protein